jgi:DNA-directed RNA polymerase specialized sigma24 family protein
MTVSGQKAVRKPGNDYATVEDFRVIFSKGTDELYQLSFLLTADHHKAEQCFVAGFEEAVKENHVFKEWARSWAKRAIIQNAIRELKPRPLATSFSLAPPPYVDPLPTDEGRHFEADGVLALPDFERFVFVMSVLEHYSEHDCALLLRCSPREVRGARLRALRQVIDPQGAVSPSEVKFERVQELFG